MKPSHVLLAFLAAAIDLSPMTAAFGRPVAQLPSSAAALRKEKNTARLPAKENLMLGIMKNPMRARGGSSSLEMSLDTNPLITSLIPKIGILTSTLLYFSPMAAVRAASKESSLGDLNPTPLAIMAVSSICWLVYGLSIQDPFVTLSNVPGCIASIWYVVAVLPLTKGNQLQTLQNIVVALAALTINLWTFLSLSNKPIEEVRKALGLFASALFILLSGSPLSTIKTVLATKDSSSILAPLTLAQITNTALWTTYGLAIKDAFVWGPNCTGLGFGLVSLLLKMLFPSK